MKLYIIEGPDNTGKSTVINELTDYYTSQNKIVKCFHCGKPEGTGIDAAMHQDKHFKELTYELIHLQTNCEIDVIILDRGWHGEAVYGTLYRERNKYPLNSSLQKMILDCDSIITDFGIDVKLVLLTVDDVRFLQKHEDGLSISKAKTENLLKECDLFDDVFNHSVLENKVRVIVNNDNLEFRNKDEIFNEVL